MDDEPLLPRNMMVHVQIAHLKVLGGPTEAGECTGT